MVQTIKPTDMHKNITLKAYISNMGTKHKILNINLNNIN